MDETAENQLELFDVGHLPPGRIARPGPGGVAVWFRSEQLILIAIAGLIGLTVIFAWGVERGKELVRSERSLLPPSRTAASPAAAETDGEPATPSPGASEAATEQPDEPQEPVPAHVIEETGPSRLAVPPDGQYAIQVVTYRKAPLARMELERLQSAGESAFLKISDGYTVLYVGPFPSKDHAAEKLRQLKTRYGDCFVRTL